MRRITAAREAKRLHLTPVEEAFLDWEDDSESNHMHVGGIMIFGPTSVERDVRLEDIRWRVAERLELLPNLKRRLSSPRTNAFRRLSWRLDPDFDIMRHVWCSGLPDGCDDRALLEWLSHFFSRRLDRGRPLWEIAVVTRLSENRWALALKIHHCAIDGVGSVLASRRLVMDDHQGATPDDLQVGPGDPGRIDDSPGEGRPTGSPGDRRNTTYFRDLLKMSLTNRKPTSVVLPTSLNVPISPGRSLAAVEVPLASLEYVTERLGGTINDVLLSISAAGVERVFAQRGERLAHNYLRIKVPVSVRSRSTSLPEGALVVVMHVSVPVFLEDALDRYRQTVAATATTKRSEVALAVAWLSDLSKNLPPFVVRGARRFLFPAGLDHITVSNIPGPAERLEAIGSPLQKVIPIVPISDLHSVGIAAVSYAGTMMIGIHADQTMHHELGTLCAGVEGGLAELVQVAKRVANK
jgi:diacylglycerol O-acyltransferase